MAEDLSYLNSGIQEQDKGVLKNLSTMGEKLKELKLAMDIKAAEAEQAKKSL